MDSPPNGWQEGPKLVESISHYSWLVVLAVLAGGVAAYLRSSTQLVRYEDAEFITSPQVIDWTETLQ